MKQDEFWTINTWPQYLADAAIKTHKNRNDRFRLMQFLIANGMNPERAEKLVLITSVKWKKNVPVEVSMQGYDMAAIRHVNSMVKQHKEGLLLKKENGIYYKVFDMHRGKPVFSEVDEPNLGAKIQADVNRWRLMYN